MELPTEVILGAAAAATAIAAGMSAAIVALWIENKGLTMRILERDDARAKKRAAAVSVREMRREVEHRERGAVSVPPVAYDDESEVLEVAWRDDQAWVRRRAEERGETPRDEVREVLAGRRSVDRVLERADRQHPTEWSDSTPPDPIHPFAPSARGRVKTPR